MLEKRFTGKKAHTPFDESATEHWIEIALVIADQYERAGFGNIISAVTAQTKK